ncbi:MAG: hypothetical protein QMD99_00355, partial [Rhizobiaceae bacterium]|nr:hypothetical protein [Rhizobiaceae bacterium]
MKKAPEALAFGAFFLSFSKRFISPGTTLAMTSARARIMSPSGPFQQVVPLNCLQQVIANDMVCQSIHFSSPTSRGSRKARLRRWRFSASMFYLGAIGRNYGTI